MCSLFGCCKDGAQFAWHAYGVLSYMHVEDALLLVVPSVCGMFADSSLLVEVTCCCVFRSPLGVILCLQSVALYFASLSFTAAACTFPPCTHLS